MARDEVDEDWRRRKAPPPPPPRRNDNLLTGWSATLVALFIGAAVVGNIISLRRRLANFHRFSEGNSATSGARGRPNTSYQETRKFYHVDEAEARRIWAAHMQEMERLRRRQEVFDRERMRYKQNYDSWQERHGDHWDWRWHGNRWEWQGESERNWYEESADNWRRQNQRTRTKAEPSRAVDSYQHYVALGLNPAQSRSYTEADIKAAFRKKAKEYHPDTNRDKVDAEKKFHQVMEAYNSLRESKAT